MPIASVNPATGESLHEFAQLTAAEIERKLALAWSAFEHWRNRPVAERAAAVGGAAGVLDSRREDYARLITLEMGRPIQPARDEIAKCALACRYYAEHSPAMLRDVAIDVAPNRARMVVQPLGPVLAVMPWNFPFWQVFRFAAPGLCAGNVGLLKHASNVPGCALAIEEVFRAAGLPEGVFQTLLIGSDAVSGIIDDPRVRAVTLTGSEPAGSDVASRAARLIKKAVLELGGSDPFIVMPSANYDEAVRTAVKARVINNGQSCIAAKRFIVHERVYDRFEEDFTGLMKSLRVGDPMDEKTDIGPLAMPSIRDEVERQVLAGRRCGRAPAHWRTAHRRSRRLLRAHRSSRNPARGARLQGGNLRPGGHAISRARHRRSDRTGQRHAVRPWLQRVDQRRRRAGTIRQTASRPVRCSSTAWSLPTRASPLAA